MLSTDARGRAHLGIPHATFKVTELDGGALLLEPARTLTATENMFLRNPQLTEQTNASLRLPADHYVPRKRRED